MDIAKVRESADQLASLLMHYSAIDEEAKQLKFALTELLEGVQSGRTVGPLDWREIPGDYYFNEGGLRKYRDLETAYADFKIELTGGESPVLRELRLRMESKGT